MTPGSFDIPKTLVWEAYQNVKANGGAAGVDHETIEQFEERLRDNPRGLDRALFQKLAEGQWIEACDNLALVGPTGVGGGARP